MTRLLVTLLLTLFAPFQNPGPYGISYKLAMPRPSSHLFEVTIDLTVPAGESSGFVDLQMPRWQPGRYSIADFAKNVQQFTARSQNKALPWEKIDDQTWRIQRQGSRSITATYRVFGDDLSGTYAQLDAGHANYTGGEIFMYVVGHKADVVDLHIDPPSKWRVVNGRTDRPNQHDWKYPYYELMIDNPTEIGPDWTVDDFKVDGKTYHVVVHSRGDEAGRRPALVRDVEKIVRAETKLWGSADFDNYTFLIHFAADDRSSDGMEHLTSAQIIEPGILSDNFGYYGALRTVAHEFFHAWNVKRLRPIELGPWDWTKPAATRGLWIGEGFTQYYGIEMYHRAGFEDSAGFLNEMSETIAAIEDSPASKLMSAEASSLAAPFMDGISYRDRTNLDNNALSYYLKGQLVALNLDLLIRGRSNGQKSLDDVMRAAYDQFYLNSPNASYYLKGRGYTIDDFAGVISNVSGLDMTTWFAKYVHGVETLPYDEAFAAVGLRLVKIPAIESRTAGIVIDRQDGQNLRLGALRADSAAEKGGLQEGDILLSIGDAAVTRQNWLYTLNHYRQGDRVSLTVRRFRETLHLTIQLGPPDVFEYRIEEMANATAEAKRLRAAWLEGN